MDGVFIYWDNSNIFHAAQSLAEERNGGEAETHYRVRITFDNMLRLAHADRPIVKAIAAGSIPPSLQNLWNQMASNGVAVELFDRGTARRSEQQVPDLYLINHMLEDLVDYEIPGVAVLLSGDGGFLRTLERMHRRGWGIEILSWEHSCSMRMREWAQENGVFIPLDDYYASVTYLEPFSPNFPVSALQPTRAATEIDLSLRPMA